MENKKLYCILFGTIIGSSFYVSQFYCPYYNDYLFFCRKTKETPDIISQKYSAESMDRYYISGFRDTSTSVSAAAIEIKINN